MRSDQYSGIHGLILHIQHIVVYQKPVVTRLYLISGEKRKWMTKRKHNQNSGHNGQSGHYARTGLGILGAVYTDIQF